MNLISFFIYLISPKKPRFVLDEHLVMCYGTKPKHHYVDTKEITPRGTSDDLLLERATKRHLLVITHDIRFVLKTLTKNQDIVYENHDGQRFLLSGKNSKLIDHNHQRNTIRWERKRVELITKLSDNTPFFLPMSGFYLVSVF